MNKIKTNSTGKWLLLLIAAFSAGMALISCQKDQFPDPSTLPKGLTGSWVETSTLADTIVFKSEEKSGYFNLSRGYAMTNGYWLPKIGSTSYSYRISGDSISVINGLSSSMDGGTYYFGFDESNLVIRTGKFSKYISTKKQNYTFRKVK